MDEILERIKTMSYDELDRLYIAIGCRVAKLDKYEDMSRAELEDWADDNNDEY
jgi:hypothetical protein